MIEEINKEVISQLSSKLYMHMCSGMPKVLTEVVKVAYWRREIIRKCVGQSIT